MLSHHVKHFLDFFGQKKGASEATVNTYCWMNSTSSQVVSGRGTLYGSFKEIGKWESDLSREGVELPTLHITLNETDLAGRKRGNIKAYRVLCCDLDREISTSELLRLYKKYKVQMVVQSSSGKYHLYWQLERNSDLTVWTKLQLAIASKLGGDLQLTLPTSMIRVPGFTRITKSGKKQRCSIMAFKDENEVYPLSVKEIVNMWPWIWEESEKGEQRLLQQRKETARIARELMRARGKDYDSSKFARMTPLAGRNTTLYLTIYDIVYSHEDSLTYEAARSFGEDVNSNFENPLEEIELDKTIRSAWRHGLRARKKRVREKQALVAALETTEVKEHKKSKQKVKEDISSIIVETILGSEQSVPESYLDISDILVSRLWTKDNLSQKAQAFTHNVLVSAHKTKYYKKLTDYLIKSMKITGAFKVAGYSVYLKGVNVAGNTVRYRKHLDQDSLSALIQDILSRLYLHAIKVSLNGKGLGSNYASEDALEVSNQSEQSIKARATSKLIDQLEESNYDSNSNGETPRKTKKEKQEKRKRQHGSQGSH